MAEMHESRFDEHAAVVADTIARWYEKNDSSGNLDDALGGLNTLLQSQGIPPLSFQQPEDSSATDIPPLAKPIGEKPQEATPAVAAETAQHIVQSVGRYKLSEQLRIAEHAARERNLSPELQAQIKRMLIENAISRWFHPPVPSTSLQPTPITEKQASLLKKR